jgi:CRISPR system Cascade subunit CasC
MDSNPFKNTRIEYHILQSFPVTCLNRDDVGAPKTAIVGGVTRARVSSQCWKRQVRLAMQDFGIKLATRTKLIERYIAQACLKEGATEEQAKLLGHIVSIALSGEEKEEKGSTLLFLSPSETAAFAKELKTVNFALDQLVGLNADILENAKSKLKPPHCKKIAALFKKGFSAAENGLDIALFGRMVAKATNMNVEAAASFAHAISTHKVNNEVEFFTALDDEQEHDESGSAHMGSLEFNSATYYRYISLDLGQLWKSLQGISLPEAVDAFTKALFVAVPNARQTTQSGASPWEFAKIYVRQGQRLQVPFEAPVKQKGDGFLNPSIETLNQYLGTKEKLAGSLFGKKVEYTFGHDGSNIDDLLTTLTQYVTTAAQCNIPHLPGGGA